MVSKLLMGKRSGRRPEIRFPVPPLPGGGRDGMVVVVVVAA